MGYHFIPIWFVKVKHWEMSNIGRMRNYRNYYDLLLMDPGQPFWRTIWTYVIDQRLPQTGQEAEKRKWNRCLQHWGRSEGGFSWCLLLQKGPPDSYGFLQGCPKVGRISLRRKSRHSLSSRLYFTRVCGALWSFLLLLGSGRSKVFTYLLISSVSPKRKSNTHPKSAERTGSEIQDSKWAE